MFQILRTCKYEHIEKFQIYGERSSGTKFLQKSLSTFDIIDTEFFGHKHFMGFAKPEKIEYSMHIMFVCIVRNPYDWILSFFKYCHHVPHMKNNFESFLSDQWYSVDDNGKEILNDRNIFDCKKRYNNIFEMRSTKIKYMIEILPNLARNFVFIRYEDLTNNHKNIMNTLKERFNLKVVSNLPKVKKPEYNLISTKYRSIINENLDWTVENNIGYYLDKKYD